VTSITQFLEDFPLYERYRPGNGSGSGAWWNGDWPESVTVGCRRCAANSPHRIWPTKLAGFTLEWGVYMIQGTCERCGQDEVMFWVEVNQGEGWMQKAGQLPALVNGARHVAVTA
jgi:hypothetical protein